MVYDDVPLVIRKHHMEIRLYDPLVMLHKPYNVPPVILVAWLYRVWSAGSIMKARRLTGFDQHTAYRMLWDLEDRLNDNVFVRQQKPFQLTELGKDIIRHYCGQ